FVKVGDDINNLTPDASKVHIASEPVFTDDNTIYFVTNFDSEYNYVAKYEIDAKQFSRVLEIEEESVESLKWHKESETFYITTEKGVSDSLYRFDLKAENPEKLEAPVAIIEKIQVARSGALYLLGRSATVPHNIFRLKNGADWTQLTKNNVLGLESGDMVEPDVVTYKSFDGMEIEALLFKPKPESDNGHTIFWPHGGPQAAERKIFRSMFQCFLNRGYTIFAPNFRGSTGYGASFAKLVEQDWGEGPRLDC